MKEPCLYLPAGDFFVADFRKIYYFCDAKKAKGRAFTDPNNPFRCYKDVCLSAGNRERQYITITTFLTDGSVRSSCLIPNPDKTAISRPCSATSAIPTLFCDSETIVSINHRLTCNCSVHDKQLNMRLRTVRRCFQGMGATKAWRSA